MHDKKITILEFKDTFIKLLDTKKRQYDVPELLGVVKMGKYCNNITKCNRKVCRRECKIIKNIIFDSNNKKRVYDRNCL